MAPPALFQNWPEIIGTFVLIVGFVLTIVLPSAILIYTVVILIGLLFGRIWFRQKGGLKFPLFVIMMALLLGIMLGAKYGDKTLVVIFFFFSMAFSYYLHDQKLIKSI